MSKNTVSLAQFSNFHDEVKGVEIRSYLDLPEYVPTSEAQVDIGRIATVSRIGRLESVNFKLFDGESNSGSATIAGINPDGSAVAAKVRSSAVARTSNELEVVDASPKNLPRGRAMIKINSNHPYMDDKPLRDMTPWSKMIDKGLRQGLQESTYNQLIKAHMGSRLVETGVGSYNSGLFILLGLPLPIAVMSTSAVVLGASMAFKKHDLEKKLIPGFAFDRYAVARSILATRKIVSVSK